MVKMTPHFMHLFDVRIIDRIMDKYGFDYWTALKDFLNSETYRMMEDPAKDMIYFAPEAIFEIWEAEKITGSPLYSAYLRLS